MLIRTAVIAGLLTVLVAGAALAQQSAGGDKAAIDRDHISESWQN